MKNVSIIWFTLSAVCFILNKNFDNYILLSIAVVSLLIGILFYVVYLKERGEEENKLIKIPLFFGEVVDGDESSFIERLKSKNDFIIEPTECDGGYIISNFNLFNSPTAKLLIYSKYNIIRHVILTCDNHLCDETIQNLKKNFYDMNYPDPYMTKYKGLIYKFSEFSLSLSIPKDNVFMFSIINLKNEEFIKNKDIENNKLDVNNFIKNN